jgi:hypothetical protein
MFAVRLNVLNCSVHLDITVVTMRLLFRACAINYCVMSAKKYKRRAADGSVSYIIATQG